MPEDNKEDFIQGHTNKSCIFSFHNKLFQRKMQSTSVTITGSIRVMISYNCRPCCSAFSQMSSNKTQKNGQNLVTIFLTHTWKLCYRE